MKLDRSLGTCRNFRPRVVTSDRGRDMNPRMEFELMISNQNKTLGACSTRCYELIPKRNPSNSLYIERLGNGEI